MLRTVEKVLADIKDTVDQTCSAKVSDGVRDEMEDLYWRLHHLVLTGDADPDDPDEIADIISLLIGMMLSHGDSAWLRHRLRAFWDLSDLVTKGQSSDG